MKIIVAILLLLVPLTAAAQDTLTLAWWNVENYFDPTDDPSKADDDFTPSGAYHWTRHKMAAKRDSIFKVVAAMGCPDVVGLAEIEGAEPLRELCLGTPLRKLGYSYLAPTLTDRRGIGCALVYRASRLAIDTAYEPPSPLPRPMIVAVGHTTSGNSLAIVLCHWPSRRNDDSLRLQAAKLLNAEVDNLRCTHPATTIVVMGDLNCEATERPIADILGLHNGQRADGAELLTQRLPSDQHSYYYRGYWSTLDHAILYPSANGNKAQIADYQVFRPSFLFTEYPTRAGRQIFRTHYGRKYRGGFSDHLPLRLTLDLANPKQ